MYENIKAAFADYFAIKDVDFLDQILSQPGNASIDPQLTYPWNIHYLVDKADDRLSIEVYAVNRFTNDRHIKISEDGSIEHFEAPIGMYSYDPNIPGDQARQEQAMYERNQKLYAELKRKGLA